MFGSVLIANRGEIACRVIRGARKLGLRAIAVYSAADAGARHVRLADAAMPIGPAEASASYLDGASIIAAAREAGADCVHPGYGFFSENADFAQACADAGLVFIGPPPAAIRAMGLKDRARALMQAAGVPVTPGCQGDDQSADALAGAAGEIGFPVMIKAVAGGGGRGMRRVDEVADFAGALAAARREAASTFGNDRVLIEKFIANPRHVEFQIFADAHGHVLHLNERDCSLQRRHQKVMEEAPAPGMTASMRAAMGRAAVAAARAVGYVGAGTVEFIAEGGAAFGEKFWFMEMNTRLQVEHPVTEAVTGLDLVEWQFRVAAGEALPWRQEDIRLDGHAVEARLYAEDPTNGFLPSSGRLWALRFPNGAGIRVDAGVDAGDEVTPHYDPMIAKIIAHAPTRETALDRLSRALDETLVAGPRTNIAFLKRLTNAPAFRGGDFDTGFMERDLAALGAAPREPDIRAVLFGAAALVARDQARLAGDGASPWDAGDSFQLGGARELEWALEVEGHRVVATIDWRQGVARAVGEGRAETAVRESEFWRSRDGALVGVEAGDAILVLRDGVQTRVARFQPSAAAAVNGADDAILSPMHGRLVALDVAKGDRVRRNQRVAVIEAMKMEHALVAPRDGIVTAVHAAVGAQVARGTVIIVIGDA